MPVPSIDFGVFIAYLVPGVIALFGLSFVIPKLRAIPRAEGGRLGVGEAIIFTVLAMTIGRIVSINRSALVDATFSVALPIVKCSSTPFLGAIPAIGPDYRQMIESGRREAYVLAVANEQRPYQFCGNTLVSVLLALGCWLSKLPKGERWNKRTVLIVTLSLVLAVLLYGGARSSYYGFMRATAAINGTPFVPMDRAGRPCMGGMVK